MLTRKIASRANAKPRPFHALIVSLKKITPATVEKITANIPITTIVRDRSMRDKAYIWEMKPIPAKIMAAMNTGFMKVAAEKPSDAKMAFFQVSERVYRS